MITAYWERAEVPWPLIKRMGDLGIVGEDILGYGCQRVLTRFQPDWR